VDRLVLALVIVGALNWGLVGFFNFDLVASLFGGMQSTLSRVVYGLVGLAGIWSISFLVRDRERVRTVDRDRMK
jgi:uncharacterized membrane protein YuzA (DUF378 family)